MKRNKKKKHIIELEEKQKKEIENLEKEYNQVLSSDLDELKKELKKSSQVNTILLIGTNNKKIIWIYIIFLSESRYWHQFSFRFGATTT